MMRLLIVERSALVRAAAARALAPDGWEVLSAPDGAQGLEVAQRVMPDLILLDPICERLEGDPGPDGVALCRALRSIANLRDIPIVLLVAEADTEAWTRETGASDAIRKPFAPEALRAAVAHAATRGTESVRTTGGSPTPHPDADAARHALEEALAHVRASEPSRDEAALFALAEPVSRALEAVHGEASFRGRLEHVALGDVLQVVQQGQTGALTLTEDTGACITVYLRDGLVDIVLAERLSHEFRLGSYLRRERLLDDDDLRLATRDARRPGSKDWIGARLRRVGAIGPEDLRAALVQQSCERLYEALRWRRGTFVFRRYVTALEAEDARLGLPMTGTLMEGLRRVDEWRLIEEQITSFDEVFVVDAYALAEVDRDRLSSLERGVVDAVDGERDVTEIIAHTRLASFDVCKVLFQLLGSRVVRRRR